MLFRIRIDEYLVATTDNRWHTREHLIVLDPEVLSDDEQVFGIETDPLAIPVAAVTLYHIGEEQQALACRVVSDETADLPNAGVWFVDIEEAQDLLDIFDPQVLIETVLLDPIRSRRLLESVRAPAGQNDPKMNYRVEIIRTREQLREALLSGACDD